jgi:hypothetical protein
VVTGERGLKEAADTLPLEGSSPHFLVRPPNVIMGSLSRSLLLTLSCPQSPLACYFRALLPASHIRLLSGTV